MQTAPQNFRGWLQIYFTAIETAVGGLTLIIAFGFPHGIPQQILFPWYAVTILLIVSTVACCFYDRHVAITGIVVLGFVALFFFG